MRSTHRFDAQSTSPVFSYSTLGQPVSGQKATISLDSDGTRALEAPM